MIAASVKDSERLVEFLLSKGADPNEKSEAMPVPNPPTQDGVPSIPPWLTPPFFFARRQHRPDGRLTCSIQEQHRHRTQALREPATGVGTGS